LRLVDFTSIRKRERFWPGAEFARLRPGENTLILFAPTSLIRGRRKFARWETAPARALDLSYLDILGILLDAGMIILLVSLVNQGEQLEFLPAAICRTAISLSCWAFVAFLGGSLGLFSLVPMAAIAIGIIWMVAKITLGRAAVAGAVFTAYKVVVSLALRAVLD
jgi:hypothetical protein